MKEILDFLTELNENNNREWFEANRQRYREVEERVKELTTGLIAGISLFDTSVSGLEAKDCLYRIYRDIRFSPDKTPYKNHIGIYVCRAGKKSNYAGYYLHMQPEASILAVGLYCAEPKVVKSVREEIFANGAEFVAAMHNCGDGFELDRSRALKRTPREFPADSEYAEYLRLKDFTLIKPLSIEGDVLQTVLSEFRNTVAFNELLNRAVSYAYQEASGR